MIYRHEQVGRFYIGFLGVMTVFLVAVAFLTRDAAPLLTIAAVTVLVCLAFGRLAIAVDAQALHWSMTFGVPGGSIPFDQIESVEIIPVTYWMGIGIHLTFRGWVWNVSLGRGVQIHRRAGQPIVLGTDDPEGLVAAIEHARGA